MLFLHIFWSPPAGRSIQWKAQGFGIPKKEIEMGNLNDLQRAAAGAGRSIRNSQSAIRNSLCRWCRRPIARGARACPHCGKWQSHLMRPWTIILLVVLVVVAAWAVNVLLAARGAGRP